MKCFYVFTPQFREDIRSIMDLLASLRAATAAVSTKLDTLTTDVNAKLAADAAALAAASENTVTQADVDAVNALATKAEALDAVVNPPAAPAAE